MLIDAIKDRRSVRKFATQLVPQTDLQIMLEAAMMAPSACNSRPWRFIVTTDREMLNKLAEGHAHAKMLQTATAAIVVLALTKEQSADFVARDFYPQDCAAATQNILLQAKHMGYGTCWCGVYPKEPLMRAVAEFLSLPEDETPFSIIAVGVADAAPKVRGYYDADKVRWI